MENLFHDFLVSVQPLKASFQIFEVMDDWMRHLDGALLAVREPDTDIDEVVFNRMKRNLKVEQETWELMRSLLPERLNDQDNDRSECEAGGTIQDVYHISELETVELSVGRNPQLKEMQTIIKWLETNYPRRKDAPDLVERFVNWEQTLETLKKDQLLGKASKHKMVQHIDPDAITREKRHIHELDEAENTKAHLACFHYLRVGDHEEAFKFLHESGNTAYGASLYGPHMTLKCEKVDMGESIPAQVIPPLNRRSTHQRPNFQVTGNVRRDLWKRTAFLICDANKQSKYERAALGALCGHRDAMLLACPSWDDQLWAYLKTSYDVGLEKELRSCSDARYIGMPAKYWDQFLDLEQSVETVNSNFPAFQPALSADLIFREVQLKTMLNTPEKFLEAYLNDLVSFIEMTSEPPSVLHHTIRFIVHLLIAYRICNYPVNTVLMDQFVELYTEILVKVGYLIYLPYYVQQMSKEYQVPLIAQHICSVTTKTVKVSTSEIEIFLTASQLSGIDPLEIGVCVIENLRAKDKDFNPDNLEWISLAYNYVDDSKLVMLALLRSVLLIARAHLQAGKTDNLKNYFRKIKPNCLEELSAISELYQTTYVKEFDCYQQYLDAVENYMRWVNIWCNEPKPDDGRVEGTLADRAVFDNKARDYRTRKQNWEKNFAAITQFAFDRFKNLLEYPNGFLANCTSEENGPREQYEVFESRRFILSNVVRYFMKLVEARKNFTLFREFMKIISCSEKNIYRSIPSDELAAVFRWAEEFIRKNSKTFARVPS